MRDLILKDAFGWKYMRVTSRGLDWYITDGRYDTASSYCSFSVHTADPDLGGRLPSWMRSSKQMCGEALDTLS
jgi:hypothetical protein